MTQRYESLALLNCDLPSYWIDGTGKAVTRNLGTLGGTVQLGDGVTPATFPAQVFPHGMSFDGGDYLLRASEAALSFTNGAGTDRPFSLECLARADAVTGGFISKGTVGVSAEYSLFLSGGSFYLGCYDAGQVTRIGRAGSSGTPGRSKTIDHYVGIYDGTETEAGIALYRNAIRIDNASYSSGAYTGMGALAQPVYAGSFPGAFNLTGAIYNWAVYPFALQPGEIASLYRSRLALSNRGA